MCSGRHCACKTGFRQEFEVLGVGAKTELTWWASLSPHRIANPIFESLDVRVCQNTTNCQRHKDNDEKESLTDASIKTSLSHLNPNSSILGHGTPHENAASGVSSDVLIQTVLGGESSIEAIYTWKRQIGGHFALVRRPVLKSDSPLKRCPTFKGLTDVRDLDRVAVSNDPGNWGFYLNSVSVVCATREFIFQTQSLIQLSSLRFHLHRRSSEIFIQDSTD